MNEAHQSNSSMESKEKPRAIRSGKKSGRNKRKRRGSSSPYDLPKISEGRLFDVLGLGALIASIGIMLNPFRNFVTESDQAGTLNQNIMQWLAYDNGAFLIGLGLTILSILFLLYRVRFRMLNVRAYWSIECPSCGKGDLKRAERKWYHRFISKIAFVPLNRFMCKDCGWRGGRIDYTHLLR